MAKKPVNAAKRETNNGKTAQFVNIDMDKSTKERFKVWAHENAPNFGDFIERLLDDGYNLSVKYDGYNDAISAFISPSRPENPHWGWILSGRGSTAFAATMGAMYRHYVILEGDWKVDAIRRSGLDDE